MHLQPVFAKMNLFNNEKYPVAETLGVRGFYIPSGVGLKDEQVYRVIEELLALFSNC